MAKKQTETAMTVQTPGALAVPDYVNTGAIAGTENIHSEDITLPRLALAQALSAAVDRDSDDYIEGLSAGDLYNSLTQSSYGRGPVPVVICHVAPSRWVEFDEERNIVDRDVPEGDPRTQWDGDTPPKATEFRDYLALHAETGEPLGLSFKGTSIRAARDLNALIKLFPNQVYNITTSARENEKGKFYVFRVTAAGRFAEEPIYKAQAELIQAWNATTVKIDEEKPASASSESSDKPPF